METKPKLTKKQQAFIDRGTHRVITVADHAREWKRMMRLRGDWWLADCVLDRNGKLLDMSSALYIGRVYVRPIENWRGRWTKKSWAAAGAKQTEAESHA